MRTILTVDERKGPARLTGFPVVVVWPSHDEVKVRMTATFDVLDDGSAVCRRFEAEPVDPDGVVVREAIGTFPWQAAKNAAQARVDHTPAPERSYEDWLAGLGPFFDGSPTGDGWYEEFSWYYRMAMNGSATPSKDIAEVHDIPISRVRRWVYEARRRGYLPPDDRGRRRP